MRVVAGQNQLLLGGNQRRRIAQRLTLRLHQGAAATFTQIQQGVELIAGKGAALARALQLDKLALLVHHKIHVRVRAAVFRIAQIQAGRTRHHACADGGDLVDNGRFAQLALADQPVNSANQRHKAARDGRRARAAVSFQYVAINGDCALAQPFTINCLAQRAADQTADFHAAAILLEAVPLLAAAGGGRQHGVFRRQPAAAFAAQKGRHALLY